MSRYKGKYFHGVQRNKWPSLLSVTENLNAWRNEYSYMFGRQNFDSSGFCCIRQWCWRQENTAFLRVKEVKHFMLSRFVMDSSSQASFKKKLNVLLRDKIVFDLKQSLLFGRYSKPHVHRRSFYFPICQSVKHNHFWLLHGLSTKSIFIALF